MLKQLKSLKKSFDLHVRKIVARSVSQPTGGSYGFFKSVVNDIPKDWNINKLILSGKIKSDSGVLEDIHSFKLKKGKDGFDLWSNYEHPEYSTTILYAHGITEKEGKDFIGKFDGYCDQKRQSKFEAMKKTNKSPNAASPTA